MKIHDENLNSYYYMKEVNLKTLHNVCNSNNMTGGEKQNHEENKDSSCKGLMAAGKE